MAHGVDWVDFVFSFGWSIVNPWTFAFLIYSLGFVILTMYLLLCQQMDRVERKQITKNKQVTNKKTANDPRNGPLAGFVVCINSSIGLRVPQVAGKTIEWAISFST